MREPTSYPFTVLIAVVLVSIGLQVERANADVPTRGPVINIVDWDGGDLPPVYERSDQLPLTQEDIVNLSRNDFAPGEIARMIQERRFVGNASAEGLIDLKKAGVDAQVIQAVSRHALPPNRALYLTVQIDFEGASTEARNRYLYVIIPDGDHERIFTADLGAVLAGQWRQDVMVDATDPLLPKRIRRITFTGEIPLKTYGQRQIQVFTSTRPGIYASADIPEADRPKIREYTIDYPACSLQQDCRLLIRYRQDALVPYKWQMVGSNLRCEWN